MALECGKCSRCSRIGVVNSERLCPNCFMGRCPIPGERVGFLSRLILSLTHRLWNRRISAILCAAKADSVIDSRQLHTLAAPSNGRDAMQRLIDEGKIRNVSFGGEFC